MCDLRGQHLVASPTVDSETEDLPHPPCGRYGSGGHVGQVNPSFHCSVPQQPHNRDLSLEAQNTVAYD